MKRAEIRKDPITNRYVIIAPGRKKRPHQFKESVKETHTDSPFTPATLQKNKQKILDSIGVGNQRVISIENIFAAVTPTNKKAYGYQEVIVETPNPDKRLADVSIQQIKNLLTMYQRRTKSLLAKPRIAYVLCFKNEGLAAGASITHAHSQVLATEIVPPRIVETRERMGEYKIKNGRSMYSDIIKKEMKSPRRVFENKHIAVFCPYASAYEHEVWIITKREMVNITKFNNAEKDSVAQSLQKILQPLKKMNIPYNYFFHSLKNSAPGHVCIRIQPRAHVWAGIELDSSMTVNWVPPEDAAKMYRRAFKKG